MEFLSENTPLPNGHSVYPWMAVRAQTIKCNSLALTSTNGENEPSVDLTSAIVNFSNLIASPNSMNPNIAPQVDMSSAVVLLTNIYEEEINFILNHNTATLNFGLLNSSADFVVSQGATCHWDDREQNCTLRRLVNAQDPNIATPHWFLALSDETASPLVDLFMYVEYHATIKLAPKTNDAWTFALQLETDPDNSFVSETVIASEYTKQFSGTGAQTRDISWIMPQVIPKPGSEGPYYRIIMRQIAGGVGEINGVDITVESMFLRVSVKPYVRSIKLF